MGNTGNILHLSFFSLFKINNFAWSAYNKCVEEIKIIQKGLDSLYMSYLFGKVRERFSFLPATCQLEQVDDCTKIAFQTDSAYCPYVRKYAEEHIVDVLAVGYKYAFFEKQLPLPMLEPIKRRILLTALVAADYPEDKVLIARRVRGFTSYCLDGLFHFRLQELKKRWEEVINYVPLDMGEEGMEGFLEFVAEDGQGKIFLKSGKAYDEEYRPLTKSLLTGVSSLIGEVLLSGAERIYCFGEVDEETANFLKKYYREKVIFC